MGKYEVKVNMPNMMKDVEVEVPFLGLIENGSTRVVELNGADAEALRKSHGITVKKQGSPKTKKLTSNAPVRTDTTATTPTKEGG